MIESTTTRSDQAAWLEAAAAWDASMTAWGASPATRQCRKKLLVKLARGGWPDPPAVRRTDVELVIGQTGLSPWSRIT